MAHQLVILFTEDGFSKLKKEYEDLLSKRPEVVNELTVARDMGDRSENAAYKSARRKLSGTDSRLRFLKKLVEHAKIVTPTQSEYVEIGSQVKVHNGTKELDFRIVGEHEADPMEGRLSYRSPVGQALLRKRVGDTITIQVPTGQIVYKLVRISLVS